MLLYCQTIETTAIRPLSNKRQAQLFASAERRANQLERGGEEDAEECVSLCQYCVSLTTGQSKPRSLPKRGTVFVAALLLSVLLLLDFPSFIVIRS